MFFTKKIRKVENEADFRAALAAGEKEITVNISTLSLASDDERQENRRPQCPIITEGVTITMRSSSEE